MSGSASNQEFMLLGNCLPVKGARRSVVCDLQRGRLRFIPNALFDILQQRGSVNAEAIEAGYPAPDAAKLQGHLELLSRENYGFWTTEPMRFRPVGLDRDGPVRCGNAIIDIGAGSTHDYDSLFQQLDELGCEAVQIRAHVEISQATMCAIVASAERQRFRHLDFLLKDGPQADCAFLRKFCGEHALVSGITVYGCAEDSQEIGDGYRVPIVRARAQFELSRCGHVDPGGFAINLMHFAESRKCNSCLNRKLSVDEHGALKACPSMKESYGDARVDRLEDVLGNERLRQLWSITKDQVDVCRDCEFRYICTDCRANTSDGGLYSKPASCRYNPYKAAWE